MKKTLPKSPATFVDVIRLWDSAEQLAGEVGEAGVTVRAWKRRKSIPPVYWHKISELSRAQKNGVTVEALARLAEQKRGAQ